MLQPKNVYPKTTSPHVINQRSFLLENPNSAVIHHPKWDGNSVLTVSDLVYGKIKPRDYTSLAVLVNKNESSLEFEHFIHAVKNLISAKMGLETDILITRRVERTQVPAEVISSSTTDMLPYSDYANKGKHRFSPAFSEMRAKIALSAHEVTMTGAFYLASKTSSLLGLTPTDDSAHFFDAKTQSAVKFEAIFEIKAAHRVIWLPISQVMPVTKEGRLSRKELIKFLQAMIFTCPHCHTLLLADKEVECHRCGSIMVVSKQ